MEKEKEIKQKKNHDGLLWIITFILFIGGVAGYMYWLEQEKQKDIAAGIVSPDPVVDAITQTAWEELPVGLVYEVPEDLQTQYLESAKAKYEKYKDLGPQQISSSDVFQHMNYIKERKDVTPRYNEKPADMLNEDFSLRYPDMFFGFMIHDESITGDISKEELEEYRSDVLGDNFVSDKMNQILFVEDYYKNGGRIYGNETLKREYWGATNSSQHKYLPELLALSRAIKSNFYEEKKNVIDGIFEYMPSLNPSITDDAYMCAFDIMAIVNTEYFKEADNIDDFPEKYNDVDSWDDSYPVFYYPTKVWKIDNNTIIVDFAVVDGDRMSHDDMNEILAKLIQSNKTTISQNLDFENYETVEYTDNTYMVLGRFYDSENITNGLLAEYGTHLINYTTLNKWYNGSWAELTDRSIYVFNDEAKDFLSDFYDLLKKDLDNGKTPSTRNLLKKAASMNNISYKDAMSIYSTYYCYSTMSYAVRKNYW